MSTRALSCSICGGCTFLSTSASVYDWTEIHHAYESGLSARECRKRFGCSRQAWNDAVRRGEIRPRPREMPIEELLVVGRRTSRSHLKIRLLTEGLKENRCEQCGISEWQGRSLSMQLHHVNGDGADNRLANIVFLCGNCRSQTDTYGGRNGHRRPASKPDAESANRAKATGDSNPTR